MRSDDHETRFDLVPYFHGRILDVSEGQSRAFPHFISHLECRIHEPWELGIFTAHSFDGVLSSNVLHLLSMDECRKALAEWLRVVRPGGHIMLHLPRGHELERWPVSYENIVNLMDSMPRDWDMVLHQEKNAYLSVFRV